MRRRGRSLEEKLLGLRKDGRSEKEKQI